VLIHRLPAKSAGERRNICLASRARFHASPPQDGLTYSLPLPSASRLNPSMSLASLRLHSPWRTWGNAPGMRLRGKQPRKLSGESVHQLFSIPDISLVEINAVPAWQLVIFLLEGASAMVLLLAYSTDGTWTSPLPLPKGEDEGEGLSSSWRT
jgi:hypothetical protein